MKLKPGDRVDRFIVEGVIGAGGTATVYRVRHERLGTRHALKILALQSEKIRERLLVEGQAQATLNHPNIVAVTDILDLDGQPGLLMEYIEGPSLEDALAEYPFTLDDLEALFLGVLDGVEVAHSLGLVHRDLKLANILLAPSPQGFVPKVTDFGLAKVLHNKPGTSATQTGVAMGTPGFMAPEQVRDAGTVDQRADLFSLGCVLYEMISKKRTFPGDEVLQIYIAVTRVDYLPIRTHVPDLPDRYEMAIRGCLQKDLGHRIPDCATLRAVVRGELGWNQGPVRVATPPPAPAPAPPPPMDDRPSMEAAPVLAVEPPPKAGDRVLPVLLVGGSLALLALVLLFAVLSIGVPLLLRITAPAGPEVAGTPSLPVPAPLPIAVEPSPTLVDIAPPPPAPVAAMEFETPTRRVVKRPRPAPAPAAPEPAPKPAPQPAMEFETPHVPRLPTLPTPAVQPAPAQVESADVASVKLYSKPPSAAILVDGEARNLRTPNKVEMSFGRHRVEVHLKGHAPYVFDLYAGPGQPEAWCADFTLGRHHTGRCP